MADPSDRVRIGIAESNGQQYAIFHCPGCDENHTW